MWYPTCYATRYAFLDCTSLTLPWPAPATVTLLKVSS